MKKKLIRYRVAEEPGEVFESVVHVADDYTDDQIVHQFTQAYKNDMCLIFETDEVKFAMPARSMYTFVVEKEEE